MRSSARQFIAGLDTGLVLVVALSFFAWAPLLGPDFLRAHDAPHSLFFLTEFDQAIRDGALYPRWAIDQAVGYGYPLFNVYPPLVFYIAELFHLLGASITGAVKITYVLGFVLSGAAMYFFAKRVLGRQAGVLAGLVYVFAPYHLVDIYVRSALAEFFAFVFLPLVMLFFYRAIVTDDGPAPASAPCPNPRPEARTEGMGVGSSKRRRDIALAGLAYAALILTHHATAFLFTPLLAAYVAFLVLLYTGRDWRQLVRRCGIALAAVLLALGISAIFWLPMLAERSYIVEAQLTRATYNFEQHFVEPGQFLSPFWGFGYSVPGLGDEMSFQIGLAAAVLSLIATLAAIWRPIRNRGLVFFFLAATLLVLAAMTSAALPLWRVLPLAALVQFPWRLLALVVLTASLLAGSILADEQSRGTLQSSRMHPALGPLAVLVALSSFAYTLPRYAPASSRAEQPVAVIDFETTYPDMRGMTAWARQFPTESPLIAQYLAGQPLTKATSLTPGATVETIRHGGASETARVKSDSGATVQFYTYFFPGWFATVDGREVPIRPEGRYGLITLDVPPGDHIVTIRFGDTPVRVVGEIVTAASLALAIFLLAKR